MKAIIVDDEKNSHRTLQQLLANSHPDVNIIASGESVEEGYKIIKRYKPEVVFLDIEMPDGSGFDLLEKVGDRHFQVIFITAHNEHAITAIKFGALDYLLKPITKEKLATALKRAHKHLDEQVSKEQFRILMETLSQFELKKLPTRIAISTSKGIFFKEVKDIIRLEAQQNYTDFYIKGHPKPVLAAINIGEYEGQFEPYEAFMKVHRSHLVNLHFADHFVKKDGYLYMKDGAAVKVSRTYREELLDRLGRI